MTATTASPSVPAVRLTHVSKVFDSGVQAVGDVSLEVRRGEFISIVGPSGCGKSTILRLVAGLSPLSGGEIDVAGQAVVGPRQDIGMMFQKPTLLPWMTALQNALLPATFQKGNHRERTDEARELLDLVGLSGFENSYPRHLSGGMQQRVALARLLMIGADVLLLDEPFAAVDELTRERLNLELLKIHARTGATIILVTHNLSEATLLGDRVVVMTPRPGEISEELEVPFARPRSPELMATTEFQELVLRARRRLEQDVHVDEVSVA
jgi:NitT/TauT family transport system ATP-binding protein